MHNAQVMLGALFSYSPDGCVPLILALHIGMGLVRALASLHRAGFLHRFVTPYNFAIEVPFSLSKIAERMLMIDLSLAKEWPAKPSYAAPFVGSPKYASVRVHREFNQAPADDIISMLIVVAEFISGKLPWRAVIKDMRTLRKMKADFPKSAQFKRLPNELRSLYRDMVKSPVYFMPDHHHILDVFKSAIARKDPEGRFELPKWLVIHMMPRE
uniref:Protein kinase domain-containing protein n=1 Tax=Ditylenchus dipsaci TaxID=166011 RepID=A0A915DMU9_9BILA